MLRGQQFLGTGLGCQRFKLLNPFIHINYGEILETKDATEGSEPRDSKLSDFLMPKCTIAFINSHRD